MNLEKYNLKFEMGLCDICWDEKLKFQIVETYQYTYPDKIKAFKKNWDICHLYPIWNEIKRCIIRNNWKKCLRYNEEKYICRKHLKEIVKRMNYKEYLTDATF